MQTRDNLDRAIADARYALQTATARLQSVEGRREGVDAVHEANRRMTLRGADLGQQLAELRARREALLAG